MPANAVRRGRAARLADTFLGSGTHPGLSGQIASAHNDGPGMGLHLALAAFAGIEDRRSCRRAGKAPLARGRDGCGLLGRRPATRLKWLCDQKPVRGV